MSKIDVLFVNPGAAQSIYQDLSVTYSAIEVPVWSLLLAQSCRNKGFSVAILDCDAERLTDAESAERIKYIDPRLVCFVVYGQNPNSGTTTMAGVESLSVHLKENYPQYPIAIVGSHASALPREVLAMSGIDIVLIGEGVYALHNLLASDLDKDLEKVKGIGHKRNGHIALNEPERLVPQDRMDIDLPGYAWDLLPYKEKPLDMYRAHFWHADFDHKKRTPFAALYTSLGCQFSCTFCMINLINRTNYSDGVTAAHSHMMRFWSPDFIIKEFDKLANMGVSTIRISDELFFLNKRYFEPLVNMLAERQYPLHMWTYSRVDTVRHRYLDVFRKAGIKWLALGIEAANTKIRREVTKGTFKEVDIREVIGLCRDHGINVIANYIYGLPDDTYETMNETLSLSLELNTEMMNCYPAQALPGSPLYYTAQQQGWELPKTWTAWSFLSYDTLPLPTKYLSSAEVLKFRDEAWMKYFTNSNYLDMVEKKFGLEQRNNIVDMTKIKLRRKILEEKHESIC